MPEFRVRLAPFDVEVDVPSHIDAAFEAANHLQDLARDNRFSYMVYEVAAVGEHGAVGSYKTVDLEQIDNVEDGTADVPWQVVYMPSLPDGRSSALPYVVQRIHNGVVEHIRTLGGTGRIIRYSNPKEALGVAVRMNRKADQ